MFWSRVSQGLIEQNNDPRMGKRIRNRLGHRYQENGNRTKGTKSDTEKLRGRAILGQFQSVFFEPVVKIGLGRVVATGEGFECSAQIHPPARSSTDVIEPLSRIATQAPKSLKSERPERIVAQFGND